MDWFIGHQSTIGTWLSVLLSIGSLAYTYWQIGPTRRAAEQAISRLQRVHTTADVVTASLLLDEVDRDLGRQEYEVARVRLGYLRTLVAEIVEALPVEERTAIQPAPTNLALIAELLGDVVDGDSGNYDASQVRRVLSGMRTTLDGLRARSRVSGGG